MYTVYKQWYNHAYTTYGDRRLISEQLA